MIPSPVPVTIPACLVLAFWLLGTQAATAQDSTTSDQDSRGGFVAEMIDIELADKQRLKGRLCLPENNGSEAVPTLVIYVHGTGPGTYLNRRKIGSRNFNYFDFLAREFCDRGLAFFSYNKRGVTMGDKPPWYDKVDREKFRQVVPSVEARDLASIVDHFKHDQRLKDSRVLLLGWSEGTMIASLAAEKYSDRFDAIFLCGYAHENLYDIIETQYSGHGSMLILNPVFDANGDRKISREEYDSEESRPAGYRKSVMQNAGFDLLDANDNQLLEAEDFAIRTRRMRATLFASIAIGNEEWIWNNYFRISIPWLREHFALEPNKTRLTRIDLPIYVFHGTGDAHVLVQGVRDLERRFKTLGKTNLKAFIFEDHDHDLNFLRWALKDDLPDGWIRIFEMASRLSETSE